MFSFLPTPVSNFWGNNSIKKCLKGFLVSLLSSIILLTRSVDTHFLLISPLAPSLPKESFAFVPGWTSAKLDNIELSALDILAWFDIPVDKDGTFYRDNSGYAIFTSEKAAALFEKAKKQNKKVLITLTLTDNESVKRFLENKDAKQTFIDEAVGELTFCGLDGIVIDFEFNGNDRLGYYRNLFTAFVEDAAAQIHTAMPGSLVTVAIASNAVRNSLYDIESLSQSADKILFMAYDFAVPEVTNNTTTAPLFGHDKISYWDTASAAFDDFLKVVPQRKLVLETAWYGNGGSYPFYESEATVYDTGFGNSLTTPLSKETIERLINNVPQSARYAAQKNIPFIAKALEEENILTPNVLAYALATIEHETAETFEPIEEIKGRKSARRLGYEGGTNYFGRGFIQLTHLRNYMRLGKRIGLGEKLAKNPQLALRPDISAKILAAFFKDNGIARLAYNGYFVDARTPINPDYQGYKIAWLASGYQQYFY